MEVWSKMKALLSTTFVSIRVTQVQRERIREAESLSSRAPILTTGVASGNFISVHYWLDFFILVDLGFLVPQLRGQIDLQRLFMWLRLGRFLFFYRRSIQLRKSKVQIQRFFFLLETS
ncbi:hypothetical protein L1987_86676 [Smallanthus sonchifolius]|uniref:Uncharacterized protein n=1 Tax=Smallanthus sonchifolius TaxID=185202 RepID=A0ACB8Y0U6_9ASTR|nr:hypothetical protein L1987_86676 [Smallanthus sonchifolius]